MYIIYIYTRLCRGIMHTLRIHIRIHLHVYLHPHIHIHIRLQPYTYTYMVVHAYMYTCMYMFSIYFYLLVYLHLEIQGLGCAFKTTHKTVPSRSHPDKRHHKEQVPASALRRCYSRSSLPLSASLSLLLSAMRGWSRVKPPLAAGPLFSSL